MTVMNDLQKCVFDIFVAFDRVCKTLNITYYLMGGTMLGAVRHQGFIPWDDDLDVGIMRKDYEVFLSRAQDLLPDYYFVQSVYTDPDYPLGISKIRDSRTTFIQSQYTGIHMNHGVFIDIFPLDYYPDGMKEKSFLFLKRIIFKYRIRPIFKSNIKHKNPVFEFFAGTFAFLLKYKYLTARDALKARDALYASIPESDMIANYYGMWREKEIVPADWYAEGASAQFEGMTVTLPKKYKLWLAQVYGDYMKLPPPEKRLSHHDVDLIDLNKPYTFYTGKV